MLILVISLTSFAIVTCRPTEGGESFDLFQEQGGPTLPDFVDPFSDGLFIEIQWSLEPQWSGSDSITFSGTNEGLSSLPDISSPDSLLFTSSSSDVSSFQLAEAKDEGTSQQIPPLGGGSIRLCVSAGQYPICCGPFSCAFKFICEADETLLCCTMNPNSGFDSSSYQSCAVASPSSSTQSSSEGGFQVVPASSPTDDSFTDDIILFIDEDPLSLAELGY